jgi:hypothetical protein
MQVVWCNDEQLTIPVDDNNSEYYTDLIGSITGVISWQRLAASHLCEVTASCVLTATGILLNSEC